MNFKNLKIGMRLGASFGLVLMLIAMLIAVSLDGMTSIGEIIDSIIYKEWVKADAAQAINAMTRANARHTMELFIASDKDKASIYQKIEDNKKTIVSTRQRRLEAQEF
ncbi:MCP four helix bundle domain-containing protein [Trinickia symbiotica]|nr:MCP four helix bundle domain-containing protein [Trinickia symbiotica]